MRECVLFMNDLTQSKYKLEWLLEDANRFIDVLQTLAMTCDLTLARFQVPFSTCCCIPGQGGGSVHTEAEAQANGNEYRPQRVPKV